MYIKINISNFRGLLERVDEMRYANIANPAQREQAHRAIRDRVQAAQDIPQRPHQEPGVAQVQPEPWIHGNPQDNLPEPLIPQQPNLQLDPPLDPPDDDDVPPLYHGEDNENPADIRPDNPGFNGFGAQNIPVPPAQGGRRPYHALARENAEALNVLLTRDLPVLTNQMQNAIGQLSELIRRQMEN